MSEAKPEQRSVVHVIGMGLSGPSGLDAGALEQLKAATLVIGAQRLLDAVSLLINARAEQWPLGNLSGVIQDLRSHLSTHPQTQAVVLTTGDPLFFGLGRLLLTQFPADQLAFYPHVSSIQLAFSRLKVPWQDATLVSLHGRGEQQLVQALKRGAAKIAVLTDAVMTPSAISALIQSLDLPIHYQLWVCEQLGDPQQERVHLHNMHERPAPTYADLNVVILLKQAPSPAAHRLDSTQLASLPLIGLPDSIFESFPDRPLLITKREIRLLILGAIAPLQNQVIWDIGAGTGSVSVELSRLCPSAQIYAIEKTAIGSALIRQNAQKLAIAPIHTISGKAPLALKPLPVPDRVFIGGSSGQLTAILDFISQTLSQKISGDCVTHEAKEDIKHTPRIVLALATIEHLNEVIQWCNQPAIAKTWQYKLTQINISRSLPVGPLTRLSPLNPVTLLTLEKNEHSRPYASSA